MAKPLPYLVEPMAPADVAQVMEIEQVVFPAPWSARAYHYEITENEFSTMLVLRPAFRLVPQRLLHRVGLLEPNPVVGYAGFWLLVDEAHICTIAVAPEWQGRGLGELLLISLLDSGQESGAIRATLEVRASNQVAQELYHKYRFRIVGRRRRYYTDNNEDAYIMTTPTFESPEFQQNLDRCRHRLVARLRAEANDTALWTASSIERAQRSQSG
jgi:ribosomal-protein-alanine N-acetyltransferase